MTRRSWQRTSRRCRTPRVTERAPPSGGIKDEAAARSAAPILDPAGRRSLGLGMGLRADVGGSGLGAPTRLLLSQARERRGRGWERAARGLGWRWPWLGKALGGSKGGDDRLAARPSPSVSRDAAHPGEGRCGLALRASYPRSSPRRRGPRRFCCCGTAGQPSPSAPDTRAGEAFRAASVSFARISPEACAPRGRRWVSGQPRAGAGWRRARRSMAPRPPKPSSIIAQVAGSGTEAVASTPANW